MASVGERIQEGNAALARGDWAEARAIFARELETRETVDALEGLAGLHGGSRTWPHASTRASVRTGSAAGRETCDARRCSHSGSPTTT